MWRSQSIAACALFLAAKVEEQPRKLEHVIKVAHMCLHRDAPTLNPASEVRVLACSLADPQSHCMW